jgi:hypothetical protein
VSIYFNPWVEVTAVGSQIPEVLYSLVARYFYPISQIWLKKNCRQNYKNPLRKNNYEVCTAVASCFPNMLNVVVLENINLSEDKIGHLPLWYNETYLLLSTFGYIGCNQCIFQPHLTFICTWA